MNDFSATPLQRWIALFVFVVAPLVLVVLTLANALQAVELGTRAGETANQLDRYRARFEAGGVAELERADLSPVFVEAGSRSLAEADLQRRIVGIIESASGRLVESGAGDLSNAEANDAIEVRATLDADNASLLRLLHAIETGTPLMTVEELAVRRLQSEENDRGGNPQLRVDMKVRAHWKAVTP